MKLMLIQKEENDDSVQLELNNFISYITKWAQCALFAHIFFAVGNNVSRETLREPPLFVCFT
jgi:hypothetical protein